MTRVKPLFWYTGGKAKLFTIYYPFFQGLHPEHCIDYFGGSGTMSLWFHRLYPQAKVYLNEKDPALYKLFKCMQEEYEEFREWLEVIDSDYSGQKGSQSKKAYYYSSRNEDYNPTQYLPDEKVSHEKWFRSYFNSVIKFFQVDITGMVRMTSSARYFNAGVGS